eukprot:Pgem_evm1s296
MEDQYNSARVQMNDINQGQQIMNPWAVSQTLIIISIAVATMNFEDNDYYKYKDFKS